MSKELLRTTVDEGLVKMHEASEQVSEEDANELADNARKEAENTRNQRRNKKTQR